MMINLTLGDYEELRFELIDQAKKDYIKALKRFNKNVEDGYALLDIMALERFFHSRWFSELTEIEPDIIIDFNRKKYLREEVRNIGRSFNDR
ncbi:hypothetical protein [Butyrivibrio sp. INlla16]|uniref:hypothetical protein n=1 Tax=Butyrivibrio sp. INlla16 TaxID=1520807 RepID=UPI00088CC67E|nr:hypothetical protein [Butyrivibrio sp. INlla16]SDB62257.1 hypothetical protein SAMN02910263_03354 [Butyrivibrio sp. INlla16]